MLKIKQGIFAIVLMFSLVCGDELMVSAETDSETSNDIELISETSVVTNESPVVVSEPSVVASGNCGHGVTYKYYANGELVISGSGEINGYSTTSMPWYLYRTTMKKLTIEEGITKLGYQSFINCTGLTSVSFPTSLKTTDQSTFSGCTNINNIYIKDIESYLKISWNYNARPSVKNGNLFLNGNLVTDLVIPNGITSIGDTFMNFASLESVTIPSSVSYLGYYAFYGCKNLKNVNLSSGLIEISPYAFQKCTALESIEIPDTVTSIGSSVFEDCTSLTKVKLSNNMTKIESYMFSGCTSLREIEIPDGIKNIYSSAFYNCRSLVDVVIPGSVGSIGYGAFNYCTSLTNVTIKNGTTTIDRSAFADCSNLSKIIIPSSVKTINLYAFSNCDKLNLVYYGGTNDEWADISIGDYNEKLTDCEIHFECDGQYIGEISKPTCTEKGYTTYTCTCGIDSYIDDEVDALKHDYKAVITDPTCKDEGYTTYTCGCGESYIDDKIAALGHDIVVDEAVAPGCETTGLTEGSHCSRCDDKTVVQEEVAALGHDIIVDKAVASGCETTGLTEGSHCSRCDDKTVAQEEVAALGHTEEVDEEVAATCTKPGLTEGKHCSVCKKVLIAQEDIPTKEHSWNNDYTIDKENSCKEEGSKSIHCANCDATKDPIVIEKLDHIYDDGVITVEPTIQKEGEKVYTCEACGDVKTEILPVVEIILPFTDVPSGKWFYESVKWAYGNGLITGTSETLFSPNAPMTRGMLVTVLYRKEGRPYVVGSNKFPDVSVNKYYANAITWTSSLNIVSGYSDGRFGPEDSITREQIAKILYRYAEYKGYDVTASEELDGFSDASKVSSYAKKYMKWTVAEGLIKGSNGKLNPKGNATRAEIAAILKRFVEKYEVVY